MALINKLEAIADAIRAKTGGSAELSLDDMVNEIEGISGGGSSDILDIELTGNLRQVFFNNRFSELFDTTKVRITTRDVTNLFEAFSMNDVLQQIPFTINIYSNYYSNINCQELYDSCHELLTVPTINWNNTSIGACFCMFNSCYKLKAIPANYFNNCNFDYLHTHNANVRSMFCNCYSLRSLPNSLNNFYSTATSYSSSFFSGAFQNCYVLDEVLNLPLGGATITSNLFVNTFTNCHRVKRITFETDNGTPIVKSWKNQTIDLASGDTGQGGIGWATIQENEGVYYNRYIAFQSIGIDNPTEKAVYSPETYALLKNDPDWYGQLAYSRYNHDSAVETINSLPDTSAYLATAGGTNTIKFKGKAGSATDGGAINKLTAAEIAVATAKGWTVTLS